MLHEQPAVVDHDVFVDVKPILDVIAVLEKPVTDGTRAQLAELLQPHKPSRSQTG